MVKMIVMQIPDQENLGGGGRRGEFREWGWGVSIEDRNFC